MTAPLGTAAAAAGVTAGDSATGVVVEAVTTGAEEISIAGIPDGEFSGRVRETYERYFFVCECFTMPRSVFCWCSSCRVPLLLH